MNDLLRGTNLYAYNSYGAYNHFHLERQEGIFSKTLRALTYYQSGVAYISASLSSIRDKIWTTDAEIEVLTKEFEERMRPLQTRRERMLTMQTDNPQSFFGDLQS